MSRFSSFKSHIIKSPKLTLVIIVAFAVFPIWLTNLSPLILKYKLLDNKKPISLNAKKKIIPTSSAKLPIPKTQRFIETKIKINKGDTLIEVLTRSQITIREATLLIKSLAQKFDPKRLKPGDHVKIIFKADNTSNSKTKNENLRDLYSVSIIPSLHDTYIVSKTLNNKYLTKKLRKIDKRTTHLSTGVIKSSLYKSALKSNIPPQIIMELIRIYSWDVDFQRDFQRGDSFRVLYEKYTLENGHFSRYGNILYSNLILREKKNPLYRFDQANTKADYYDPNGRSARKALMRTPINGARLSSGYGRRKHPILGYSKMHRGLDFAAPIGTPIFAAGNGKIAYKGWHKTYGNYLKIRHNSTYITVYAHLSKFHRITKSGARVKQGQVIGYVGTTGRSTGPHLHYEIIKSGRKTNPLKIKMPSGLRLKGSILKKFLAHKQNIHTILEKKASKDQIQKKYPIRKYTTFTQ